MGWKEVAVGRFGVDARSNLLLLNRLAALGQQLSGVAPDYDLSDSLV